MRLEKKQIFILLVVSLGGLSTVLCSFLYYNSIYQEDMLYEEIPFQNGMSFTTWGAASFNSSEAEAEILKMKAINIEWVGVNIWWYQDNITSDLIYDGDWTDTSANITGLFDFIHNQSMKVFFKPMLDSKDGIWRSYIESSTEWIQEYNRFIKYTAEIAENGSAELFSIGCGMGNWQIQETEVISLISDVREIYSGKLTYSANHDSFSYINFWDKLDIIGVDAYFSFTLSYSPTLQDMIEVWDGFYDDLTKYQRRWNKPILFTELGCQNRDGANIAPNDNKFNLNQDEEEFKMYYQSLFESKIWSAPWFKGTYWWMWDIRQIDEATDNGFTQQLSIIQTTINKYYSRERTIIYPNYFIETLFIILLGSVITIGTIVLIQKFFLDPEQINRNANKKEIDEVKSQKNKVISQFILINGISFRTLLFLAFTYYN